MITRIYIEHFGGLSDKEIIFSEGLNIVYGKNESGKTTISAFIRAMLYGVDTQRKRDIRGNMRKRYTPLNGSMMSGVLETEEIVITRTFGASSKFDTCNAVNRFTGEVIPPEDIGYAVMGMNESCFCNTFYLNSFGAYPVSEAEMMEKLSLGGHGGGEEAPYDKVCSVLDDMAKPYIKRSGAVDTALAELHKAQETYQYEEQKKKEYQELKTSYNTLVQKGKSAKTELLRLQSEKEKMNKQNIELRNRQKQLFEEMAEEKPAVSPINKGAAVMAVIFALIGMLFVFSYKYPMLILCVCSFVPMVICLKVSKIFKRRERAEQSTDARLAAIENIIAKTAKNESADIDERIKKINAFLIECAERIGRAETEMKSVNIDEQAEEKLTSAKEKYEKAVLERDCIQAAKYVLTQAYEELKCDFMPEVNELFSKYFNRLTSGKYHSAASDRDMNISVIDKSGAVLGEYLSGGTLDGANFSLRLALCDKIDADDRATLVIDDALLQYDDERVKNALQMISEMNRQTIYFSCREVFANANFIKL